MYKHIYGPVPSRRLGISLGIDLVPLKVCSYNCVYCECGKSGNLLIDRKEYIPSDEILDEIRDFLKNNPMPDYLTLSGSGEPTLHSGIGYIINSIKKDFPDSHIAVITNGCFLYRKDVRDELMEADIILPSLDAAMQKAFIQIDRPHPGLSLPDIIEGIKQFTKEFKSLGNQKQIWLEIFIIEGMNTDEENIRALRDACLRINPDKIQLNTLDRPGAESWVTPASNETLEMFSIKLDIKNVEIITRFKERKEIRSYSNNLENLILDTLKRRPLTLQDLSIITGQNPNEISKYIDILENEKKIAGEIHSGDTDRGIFYKIQSGEYNLS